MTPQETDPDLLVSVQESGRGVGQQWPAAGLGALGVSAPAWDLLKEVTISCGKKRSEKQRIKGKIFPFEGRVPKNSQER